MRKIAIVGFKGGIGKTTTCVTLGAGLALRGHRVLLIDTDTQANVAVSLGVKGYRLSLAEVLIRKVKPDDVIINARPNLDLLPGSLMLFKAQQRMVLEMAREEMFNETLDSLNGYDYQLLDCAPSLSSLTINSIAYADEVIIPVSMEILAMSGAQQFIEYLQELNQVLHTGAELRLILPTMYDSRRRVSKFVLNQLKGFGPNVAKPIRIDTRLSEAPGFGKTIFEYAPHSRGAIDYARFTELVARMPAISSNSSSKPEPGPSARVV
jgi:chromosome partitioning protein